MKPRNFITPVVALQFASAAFGQLYQTDFTTAQGWTISSAQCTSTSRDVLRLTRLGL